MDEHARHVCQLAFTTAPQTGQCDTPIMAMASNPAVVDSLWDWVVTDLASFESFHPVLFERVIAGIVPIGGLGREENVKSFFDAYLKKNEAPKDVVMMALELMEINARMRQ